MIKNTVLITGAAGGLGKAFAVECASRGWNLFLTDLSLEKLQTLASGLERMYGVKAITRACDLTDQDARKGLWQDVSRSGIRFHFLINVAGLDYEGPFSQRMADELDAIIRLNIEATVDTTRRMLALRDQAEMLHIINVSSLAAFYPMPVKAVYAASKRFLLDWSIALHQELRDNHVTVTALCPAGMPTHPACIRSIDSQGFMGRITTMNVGDVAARTVDHALAGHCVYIPGLVNQFIRRVGSLVPPSMLALLINRRWQKSYQIAHGVEKINELPLHSPRAVV